MQTVTVLVSGSDYSACVAAAENFWSSKKGGMYGAGLVNSSTDKRKVERTGLLGEMAFARTFGLKPDLEYREHGRKYDFIYKKIKVDVKTAVRNYGSGLILAINENGVKIPLHCDVYVFSHIVYDDIVNLSAKIEFSGYQTRNFINNIQPQLSSLRGATHKNYVVRHRDLIPIMELKNE